VHEGYFTGKGARGLAQLILTGRRDRELNQRVAERNVGNGCCCASETATPPTGAATTTLTRPVRCID